MFYMIISLMILLQTPRFRLYHFIFVSYSSGIQIQMEFVIVMYDYKAYHTVYAHTCIHQNYVSKIMPV